MKKHSKILIFLIVLSLLCPTLLTSVTANAYYSTSAYFCWKNSNGTLSYHKFSDLSDFNSINYIGASELVDDSGNGMNYQWGQEPANWVLAGDLEDENGNILPEANAQYVFGNGADDMGCQLDPCCDAEGAGSIASNGDRHFRAVIYLEDQYEAISFRSNGGDYEYFPYCWDTTFFTSTIDISRTTKENPAVFKTSLYNSSLEFTTGFHSVSEIVSVKPLDVKDNAVEVSLDEMMEKFTVNFNSNYYNNVVFEAEAENGNKYYFTIQRLATYAIDNFGSNMTEAKVYVALYYPRTTIYTDFDVVATVYRYDKKPVTQILNPISANSSDPYLNRLITGSPGPDEFSLEGGKNLFESVYSVSLGSDITSRADITNKVEGVAFTVINKDDTNGNTYGGTLCGSGRGEFYDTNLRRITKKNADTYKNETADDVSLNVSVDENTLNIFGKAEDGTLAVAIPVYNQNDELITVRTAAVDSNNNFSSSIDIEDGKYVVKAADYNGGNFMTKEVTVGKEEPEPTPTPAPAPTKPDAIQTIDGNVYRILTYADKTDGTVTLVKARNIKNVSIPSSVNIQGKTYKVVQVDKEAFKATITGKVTLGANIAKICPNAFTGSKVKTVILKTGKLRKASVKNSLKKSKVKTVKVKVGKKKINKKFVKKYKKIFTKKNCGKKVKVK